MWYIYVLYSIGGCKTYTGYTNDLERRLREHNFTEARGFTLRYRPWTMIHTEPYSSKPEAMAREKYLKTGRGREELKIIVDNFLTNGVVSAAAEKDLNPIVISGCCSASSE